VSHAEATSNDFDVFQKKHARCTQVLSIGLRTHATSYDNNPLPIPSRIKQIQNEWDDLIKHSCQVTLKDFNTPERQSSFKDAALALLIHRFL